MVAFFTCIGLSANPTVVRKSGVAIVLFLAVTSVLAALQMAVGVGVALGLGESPLLGLLCGAISMTGGHATSAAFSPLVEDAGAAGALGIGITAATFGLVAGGLVGGPVGAVLIRKRKLRTSGDTSVPVSTAGSAPTTFLSEITTLFATPRRALWHLAALAVSLKLGAWVCYGLGSIEVAGAPLVLPGYIGAMIVGIALRSSLELTGRPWIRDRVVALMMFVFLDLFLAIAVMSVDLVQLAHVAIPMLVILTAQVAFMVIFAATVTFRTMGSDYNAAILAAGHCGFGLGASPNAVANMESLVKRHGPAPEAFLVLPIAAGFLLDFTNAAVISLSIRLFS
jgi:ESS family glutamate:Na+ symporter